MSDYNKNGFNVYKVTDGIVVIKWYDQNKRPQRKEYEDWREARKAVKWLVESGVDGVDVAVPADYISASQFTKKSD